MGRAACRSVRSPPLAGVGRTTVQAATRKARALGLIEVRERRLHASET